MVSHFSIAEKIDTDVLIQLIADAAAIVAAPLVLGAITASAFRPRRRSSVDPAVLIAVAVIPFAITTPIPDILWQLAKVTIVDIILGERRHGDGRQYEDEGKVLLHGCSLWRLLETVGPLA